MTTFDEAGLINALDDAASGFEVSKDATDRILSAAGDGAPSRHALAFVPQGRGRKVLAVAAAVLVVGGLSLPLLRNEGGTPKGVSGSHASSLAPRTVNGTGDLSFSVAGAPSSASQSDSRSAALTSANATGLSKGAITLTPKIESRGSVHIVVGKGRIESAFTKLAGLASKDGGSVASSHAHVGTKDSGTFASGTIVLQVPQRAFATLVAQVQRVGHVSSVATTSTDVTSQYVDLRARIDALQVSRRQYLAIMTRATTISGILAVQSQLDAIQSQIEQFQGQMNVLDNETTFATLSISLTEAGQTLHVSHASSGIAKAWHDAISGFVAGFEWVIRASGPVLFVALCLGVLLALGRFGWRIGRRRRI
jgi:hypothetical protein